MIRSILFLLALIVAAFGQTVPSITNVTNAAIPELELVQQIALIARPIVTLPIGIGFHPCGATPGLRQIGWSIRARIRSVMSKHSLQS
jgi:hypothetical protein